MHYSDAFDATGATVIPILLLALGLQGDFLLRTWLVGWRFTDEALRAEPGYEEWIRAPFWEARRMDFRRTLSPPSVPFVVGVKRRVGVIFIVTSVGIVIASVIGEVVAALGLAKQESSTFWQTFLFWVLVVLAVLVGIAFFIKQTEELLGMFSRPSPPKGPEVEN